MSELVRALKPYEPVIDLVRLACFAAFVALGLWVARGGAGARRRVDLLIAYVLAITLAVGLVQQESWPFTNWALVHGRSPARARSWEMEGLDATGRGYVIDPRILEPMAPEDFGSWMFANLPRLDEAGRADVGRFVLTRAETGRRRLRTEGRVAPNGWLLGALAAPHHFTQGFTWRSTSEVPPTPFVAVRVWELEWNVEERYLDESRVRRRVLIEFRDGSGPA